MKLLFNNVLLEIIQEEPAKNGVIIPDNAKDKPTRGKVLSVGPGMYFEGAFEKTTVQEGDIVLFPTWAGSFNEVSIPGYEDGQKLATIRETDIIGIL